MAWWFPFQNVSDIVKATRATVSGGTLALWWGLWVGSNVIYWIANQMTLRADSAPAVNAAIGFSIFGSVLTIAAAPFAWMILTRVTAALDPR